MAKSGQGMRGLLRVLAGLFMGLFFFCVAVPAAAASTPSPTPSPKPPALPVSLHLGQLDVNVVLPLSLDALLGKTPPPTTAPPKPTPPTPTTPTQTAPTSSRPTAHPAQPSGATARPSLPLNPADAAAERVPASRIIASQSSPPRESSSPARHRHTGALVFVKELVPASGSMLLIALCAACALGVVAVLKLSGRRPQKH